MSKVSLIKTVVSIIFVTVMTSIGFSSAANASDISDWQKDVSSAIAKKQSYPRAALRKSIEGNIKVEINVDRDGNIVEHNMLASSGHDVLDREVPKLMKRVSPLPKPPSSASEGELKMVVPLAWALQ